MKRFFGKRRATRSALGELTVQPFGRLGALVFQLNNSDKLYWASLWAPTRIAGCALSFWPDCHPLGKRFPRKSPPQLAERFLNFGGCAGKSTSSFSLCAVVAKYSREALGTSLSCCRERNASALHGRTERSGCTAAEPYPPSRSDTLRMRRNHLKGKMD